MFKYTSDFIQSFGLDFPSCRILLAICFINKKHESAVKCREVTKKAHSKVMTNEMATGSFPSLCALLPFFWMLLQQAIQERAISGSNVS